MITSSRQNDIATTGQLLLFIDSRENEEKKKHALES